MRGARRARACSAAFAAAAQLQPPTAARAASATLRAAMLSCLTPRLYGAARAGAFPPPLPAAALPLLHLSPRAAAPGALASRSPLRTARHASSLRAARRAKAAEPAPSLAAPPAKLAAVATAEELPVEWDPNPGAAWDAVSRWVVFSDLHVSTRSEAVCLAVLREVLAAAKAHDAGVLFLGDFWHARGALPVAPLNAILDAMARWDVPTVMIPGNHDQVSAGGEEHALTPLGAARPSHIHIFSRPALWRRALWLPYRREHAPLRAAMAAALRQERALAAVFAHADVVGASLNESHQARNGLEPGAFPEGVPVFTGHYHSPHTVPGTAITYVGAPYQVSLSEAGQSKRLLLLDDQWRHVRDLPLDVGPRHYALTGADASPPPGLRPGDRVRWTLPAAATGAAAPPAPPPAAAALADAGVVVELVRAAAAAPPRIAQAERLGPPALLDAFADATGMRPEVRTLAAQLLAGVSAPGAQLSRAPAELVLDSMELEGYGPFRDETVYQFPRSGMVIVTGRNTDEAATADSNGAGKTTLVMAPLWALTGDADCGGGMGGGGGGGRLTAAQVVSDGAREARVRLSGTLNGQPFWLERATSTKSLRHLRWGLGDAERTAADARLTQAALDEALDTKLLALTCFHGQHSIEALLDANDAAFKGALGRLVSLEVWEAARSASFEALKAVKEEAARHASVAAALEPLAAQQRAAATAAAREVAEWAASHAEHVAQAEELQRTQLADAEAAGAMLHEAVAELRHAHATAEAAAAKATAESNRAAARAKALSEEVEAMEAAASVAVAAAEEQALHAAALATDQAHATLDAANAAASAQKVVAAAAAQELRAARTAAEAFRGVASAPHQHGSSDGGELGVCDRCAQPIDAAHFAGHAAELDAAAEAAASAAQTASASSAAAAAQVVSAQHALAAARDAQRRAEAEARSAAERARAAVDAERSAAWARRSAAADVAAAAARDAAALNAHVAAALHAGVGAAGVLAELAQLLDAPPPQPRQPPPADVAAEVALAELLGATRAVAEREPGARGALEAARRAAAALTAARRENNASAEAALLRQRAAAADAEAQLAAALAAQAAAEARRSLLAEADAALNRGGIQSYLFDEVLAQLEERADRLLQELTAGALTVRLRSSAGGGPAPLAAGGEEKKKRGRRASAAPDDAAAGAPAAAPGAKEAVAKVVWARGPDGTLVERGVRQLSGGERRRVALALSLAFAELAAERGGVTCSLLVLDEALQHLDSEGAAAVARMLRRVAGDAAVLLTSQAGSRALALADRVDYVVKERAQARIERAE